MKTSENLRKELRKSSTDRLIHLWLYSPSIAVSIIAEEELEARQICLDSSSKDYLKKVGKK